MSSFFTMEVVELPIDIWSLDGIFILVLTSSVLAAALTSIFDWLISNKNYRNDYYKIIISKRVETYEKFDFLLGQIHNHSRLNDSIILKLFRDPNHLTMISELREDVALQLRWLSNELINDFNELWTILLNVQIDLPKRTLKEQEEIERSKEIQIILFRLFEQSEKDFKSLHKVKKFLKTSKK